FRAMKEQYHEIARAMGSCRNVSTRGISNSWFATGAADLKFRSICRALVSELQIEKRHQNHRVASPHFSHSMPPAPVQEADRVEAVRGSIWWIGQARRCTLSASSTGPPGCLLAGISGLGRLNRMPRYAFRRADAVSASPKAQRRRHGV